MQLKQAERVRSFLTKKDALRKLLIKFAQEEEIDAELLKKDFKVEEFEKEFLVVTGQAECSYTCSIGYDRKENYVEIEKTQKLINGKWQYVNEPVNKTRTVTDWQAHSGTKRSKERIIVAADGESPDGYRDAYCSLEEMETDVFDYYSTVEEDVLAKCENKLASACLTGVRFDLPGDQCRDLSGDGSATIEKVSRVFITYYKISYNHKGEERTIEVCASLKDFKASLADDEKEPLKFEPRDTKALAKEAVEPKKKGLIAAWIGVALSAIPSAFLSFLFFLPFVMIVVAIVVTFKFFKAKNDFKIQFDREDRERKAGLLKEKQAAVFEVLCEAIKKNELAPCAYEEVYPTEK